MYVWASLATDDLWNKVCESWIATVVKTVLQCPVQCPESSWKTYHLRYVYPAYALNISCFSSICTECSAVGMGWSPAPLLQKPITSALLTAAHIHPPQSPSHGFNGSCLDVRVSDATKRSFSDLKAICLVCKSMHIRSKMTFKCWSVHLSENQSFCICYWCFNLSYL